MPDWLVAMLAAVAGALVERWVAHAISPLAQCHTFPSIPFDRGTCLISWSGPSCNQSARMPWRFKDVEGRSQLE